jgi:N-ethylmaleimide reductase
MADATVFIEHRHSQPWISARESPTDRLRPLFRRTLIVNGGYDRQRADAVIRSGVADLVSFGKAFLANPNLPQRLKIGAALNVPDPDTFYGGGEKGYVDYPAL